MGNLLKVINVGDGSDSMYSMFWTTEAQAAIPQATCNVRIMVYPTWWHIFGQFQTHETNGVPIDVAVGSFSSVGLTVKQESIFLNTGSNLTNNAPDTVMAFILFGMSASDNTLFCQGGWNPTTNGRGTPETNHKFWINYTYALNA